MQEKLEQNKSPHQRSDVRALLAVAVPLAGGHLSEVAMGITDMVIVGRLGAIELAAVGLSAGLAWDFLYICFGVTTIVGVMSAKAYGAGDEQLVGKTVAQGFWVAILLAFLAHAFIWGLPSLFALSGQDPEVVQLARDYLWPLGWCVIPVLAFFVLRNLVTALARTAVISAILVPGIFLNLLLNYGLVFGKFGMPALGVAGAGWGSMIVCWFMFFGLLGYVLFDRQFRSFDIRPRLRNLDIGICKKIFRLGVPVGMFNVIEVGMYSVIALIMGSFGAVYLATGEVLLTFTESALVMAFALGEAASIRIAYSMGQKTPARGKQAALLAFMLGGSVMLLAAIFVYTMPTTLTAIFLDIGDPANQEVLNLVPVFAGLAALFLILDGWQLIAGQALKGLQDTVIPMWIAAVGYLVFGLGGGVLICFAAGMGPVGLWWGIAMGLAVIAVSLTLRFARQMNRALVAN